MVTRQELARIRAVLAYNPRTGKLVWLVKQRRHGGVAYPGDEAGTYITERNGDKRVIVGVNGRRHRAHRLAFFFMNGLLPPDNIDVDHINGDDFDNRWCNLRLASRSQNNCNTHKVRSDNKSGVTGVSWSIQGKGWTARVTVNRKVIHLGYFGEDLEAAKQARREAELHYYGAFAPR